MQLSMAWRRMLVRFPRWKDNSCDARQTMENVGKNLFICQRIDGRKDNYRSIFRKEYREREAQHRFLSRVANRR